MEDEIDLHKYVSVIIRRWPWVVGLTLAAALTAFGIGVTQPKRYTASALVSILKPRYAVQFDNRIQVVNAPTTTQIYLSLATSDVLLQQLLEAPAVVLLLKGETVSSLRGKLQASSGTDPTLIVLKVTDNDPAQAAAVVNAWAELYVLGADQTYTQAQKDQTFFEAQLAEADQHWKQVDADWLAFQATNPEMSIGATLDAKLNLLKEYLQGLHSLSLMTQETMRLREELTAQAPDSPAQLGDELTALTLKLELLSSPSLETASAPIPQFQLSSDALGLNDKIVGEQIAFLDDLLGALKTKSRELQAVVDALQPEILALQEKSATIKAQEARLKLERDLAMEAYQTLARKMAETKIALASGQRELALENRADVPTVPAGQGRVVSTIVGGALGLLVSVSGVLVWEWWKAPISRRRAEAET